MLDANLPGLPAVEADGSFAGVFGAREFMSAFFPAYVGELATSAMISRAVDRVIDRRLSCAEKPIREYLTTDHVLVEDDYSDTQLAELFLHHRVPVIPIATHGRIHSVVTCDDFFTALADHMLAAIDEDVGA